MTSARRCDLTLDDPAVTVTVRRSRSARRLSLSVSHIDGAARVTAPHHCSDAALLRFVQSHKDWLRRAIDEGARRRPIADGQSVPFAGGALRIQATPGRRGVFWRETDGILLVGGPAERAGQRAVVWLKEQARARLVERSEFHAARLGVRFSRIAIRDTRSRWGSCSSGGALSFSWRLIFAPERVLDYVAAHEVAHLKEMNHSDRFWALVAQLKPDWREDRDWLKAHGMELHRYHAAAPDPGRSFSGSAAASAS